MSEPPQGGPLRVLLLEDSPTDAKLVMRELTRMQPDLEWRRVESADAMREALEREAWDVVLSDWSMPRFGALDALAVLESTGRDIPFILVSGTIGEEAAAEAMRRGVRDYVLKDNLARLVPAVTRELAERDARAGRRRAEQALRESEARYRRIVETTNEGVLTTDGNDRITFLNGRMAAMLGYDASEGIGRDVVDLLPDASSADARRLIAELRSEVAAQLEQELKRRDGSTFWALVGTTPIFDDARAFDGALVMIMDISGRKASEAALRASEAKFARLAESGIIGICAANVNGRVYDANDAYLAMIGYSRTDLTEGRIDWQGITPPEWRSSDDRALESIRATGIAKPWEKELLRKDGSRIPVLIGVAMLDAAICVAFQADLSERKRAEDALRATEAQFRQAQKMEAVGLLAGGVAHDFNNLLSVILSYSESLAEGLSESDPMREELEEIRMAGERAAELTRQLLAFSRRQVLRPEPVNLAEVVSRIERMLRRLIGEDIELLVVTPTELDTVNIDPGQFEQVLVNVVVNARDAMPTGGKLTVEISNVDLDADYAAEHAGVVPGRHVLLAVSDTGVGMDEATRARIFEPFFTTKETGRGTGLGLSTVYGLVTQSGGHIWVYSEPHVGTTFKIYLPAATRTHRTPSATPTVQSNATSGSETILLVEDDEHVRHLARVILGRFGYKVLEAAGVGDALLICEQHPATIHLLLTDVVMPRMSGSQLAARARVLRPALRVLYMSGYTDRSIVHHGVLDSDAAFLQKPLTPDALGRKVRQVLDTPV